MAEEEKQDEKLENIVAITVFVVITILVLGFWNNWWGLFNETSDNPLTTTQIQGEPWKGDSSTPITIVEYSDFECPFCGRFHQEVMPRIQEELVDTGRVKLVFKQFPLTQIHPNAMNAAIASECAYRQSDELFWEYHDLLFENQQSLSSEALKSYAAQAGLDQKRFDLCYANKATQSEVEQDYREGVEAGVTGTPAFIIGENYPVRGELLVGAQPFSKFLEAVERFE